MHRTIRPTLSLWLAMACAIVSVPATAQDAPPDNSGDPGPAAKEQPPDTSEEPKGAQPERAATQPESSSAVDAPVRTPPRVSPEEVLRAFQMDRPTRVPIAPSEGTGVTATDAEPSLPRTSRRLPDGFFLVDRVGRVVKDGDWYVFVFEGYSESHPETPIKLLPNQLLERMVLETEAGTGSTVFIVSGEVTEFRSENYLLLRKLLRRRSLGNLGK